MKKYRYYNSANDYLMDKNLAIDLHMNLMIEKSLRMFHYKGLPPTIPFSQLEKILQTTGNCVIAKVNGKLYALEGTLGGELDEYNRPTLYVVSNVWLNHYHEYGINGNDSGDNVFCKNDFYNMGLLPIYKKFGALLTENYITFRTLTISMRSILNLSAGDDRTAQGAKDYLNKLENGEIGVIAENQFFDGVKVHNGINNNNYLTQFIELNQYLKSSELQEIGINSNFNMKREYIGSSENELNTDILRPLIDGMLELRRDFCEKCNSLFGTDISVDLASVWKMRKAKDFSQLKEPSKDSDPPNSVEPSKDSDPPKGGEPNNE